MGITQLALTGTPGKRYSFVAKDVATPESGEHTGGPFTELSVNGVSGQRHSFLAKDITSSESGSHTGLFTELSVSALPGKRHSFLEKSLAVSETITPGGTGYFYKDKGFGNSEEEEIMGLIATIITSGMLD